MLGDLMSSVQPIEIKIYGTNRSALDDLSRQIAEEVSQIPGTASCLFTDSNALVTVVAESASGT
jgi:Cu/Ag efflux pump CusA